MFLQLAKAYGMDFFETSAFTNQNITEVHICLQSSFTCQFFCNWLLVCLFICTIKQQNVQHVFLQPWLCLHNFVLCFPACSYFTYSCPLHFFPWQSFTRLAELVLQANKKDLDLLGGSINDEFSLADLEEQEGLCNAGDNTRKSCWCWRREVTRPHFYMIFFSVYMLHFDYPFE